jgi:hypothetical protein
MLKKYQVFVSSTYTDLKEERAQVIQALLEMKCIPVGMELFPATDTDQLTYIRQEIAESDYYIVIVGGRYGSINPDTGRSYTEDELQIARDLHIPCLAFFREEIDSLPAEKREDDPEKQKKLAAFRDRVLKKLGKSWTDPKDLAGKVSRSLAQLMQTRPGRGWIRNEVTIERPVAASDVAMLSGEIRELKRLVSDRNVAPAPSPETEHAVPSSAPPHQPRALLSFRGTLLGKEPLLFGTVCTIPSTLLIRAVGPTLSKFGIPNPVPHPAVRVFRLGGQAAIRDSSVDTSAAEKREIDEAAAAAGAFPLNAGATDAAVLVRTDPGALTIQVSSIGSYTGTVLVEVYEL